MTRDLLFTLALTVASKSFALRDRILRKGVATGPASSPQVKYSRHTIRSGRNSLDAVLVEPAAMDPIASLLICHGIGETVDYWFLAQHLLAVHGITSLVFDYSGYGQSSGFIRAEQCRQDAVSAFHFLQQITAARPVSILGFSLGSGIAVSIMREIEPHRLILCAAYTSFAAAARCVGVPAFFDFAVPALWDSEAGLLDCPVPVLIVHGELDRLFPMQMAKDLHAACGASSRLVIVPGLGHDDPYFRPRPSYWELIAFECAIGV